MRTTRMLHFRTALSCALLGAITMFAASTSSAQNPAPRVTAANLPAGDATRGSQLYLKNGCWQCHGYGAATGAANVPALVLSGFRADGFVNYLRSPRTRAMPLYSAKVVSDQDAADIFAFIRAQKKPMDAKEIPLLQRIMDEK